MLLTCYYFSFVYAPEGHFPVTVYGTTFCIPIHSSVAFLMGITLVENLNLLPSYFFFCIAWFLLATYEARRAHPSPWAGCLRLRHMYTMIMKSKPIAESISPNENVAVVIAYEEENKRRYQEEQEILNARHETAQQLTALYGQGATMTEDISTDRVTKIDGNLVTDLINSVNPLATNLLPYQQMTGRVASWIRIFRSIITWDENFAAFYILNACIMLGILFLYVPWGFITRWFFRLAIWIFLGRKLLYHRVAVSTSLIKRKTYISIAF